MYSWPVMSTSKHGEYYHIVIDTEDKAVDCDCKSGRIRGYCKHIRFYKKLIMTLLYEKPGPGEENGRS